MPLMCGLSHNDKDLHPITMEASILQSFRSRKRDGNDTNRAAPHNNASLCQSMDLIMVKDSTAVPPSTTTPVVKVFNTVDRREVATLQVRGGDLHPSKASLLQESPNLIPTISCFAWSPNGQSVAVVTSPTPSNPFSYVSLFNILAANGTEPLEPYHVTEVEGAVEQARWEMAGKDPDNWVSFSEEEEELEMAKMYQLRYADQSLKFLPQSGYVNGEGGITLMDANTAMEENGEMPVAVPPDEDISTITPKAQNALTILALTTRKDKDKASCELFVHGRLRLGAFDYQTANAIASKQMIDGASNHHCLCAGSHDMTYWMALSSSGSQGENKETSCTLSMVHIPWIREKQPHLLQVSASLASIYQSVQTLEQSVVADDWKTSLRRLDQIIQMMVDELKKYGITATTGTTSRGPNAANENVLDLADVIKEYIAAGATADGRSDDEYSNVANAMDTFFTKGQLHDRLMERLVESMQTALANVELSVEMYLLRPARALRVQAVELIRLSLQEQALMDELSDASEDLLGCVMLLQKRVVHSRSVIKEFCEWLRSSRAMVQSKGNSANPNLKKRRMQPRVLNGLIAVLNSRDTNAGRVSTVPQVALTESLLNLRVTELLKGDVDEDRESDSIACTAKVQPTLRRIQAIVNDKLKDRPLLDECESIQSLEMALPGSLDVAKTVLRTRLGTDIEEDEREMWMDDDSDAEPNCFIPTISVKSEGLELLGDLTSCRQWGVIATWESDVVQLFCLPFGWHGSDNIVYNDSLPFYLTAMMKLPHNNQTILSVAFYGDDGKSNLASGMDGGTGKEGTHELIILCQSKDSPSPELHLISYDDIEWEAKQGEIVLRDHVDAACCHEIVPAKAEDDSDEANPSCDAQVIALPDNMAGDEYVLDVSPTRSTILVTSIKSQEKIVTHYVIERKDDDEEEEEEEEDDEEDYE